MFVNEEIEMMCKNIVHLRKKNGLSQIQMAGKLGIGVKSLQKIEQNQLPPKLTVDMLYNIQRNFNIAPSDIFKELT